MENLNDSEIEIVKQMLHILKTCRREGGRGVCYYRQGKKEIYFVALCSLVKHLTKNLEILKKLYNYLLSYTGPRNSIGSAYWFSFKSFEFFEHRILFLEYVLQLNEETKDGKIN